MDKSVVNNIWRDINCVETIPLATDDIVKDCKFLLGEVERLEARHKADQMAVEEANAIAEDYRNKLNSIKRKLFDAQNELVFFETSYESIRKICVDLQDKNIELQKVIDGKKSDLKTIPTMVLVNELASREGVFKEYVTDHNSRRMSVYGPASIIIVSL